MAVVNKIVAPKLRDMASSADVQPAAPGGECLIWVAATVTAMIRARVQVDYAGRVQGVGFRYTVKSLVTGFEVAGTVRNLPDGRVELIAEGARPELETFLQAVRDSGVGGLIADESAVWSNARGEFCGFEIIG